jgi:hypothetical protein
MRRQKQVQHVKKQHEDQNYKIDGGFEFNE